MSFRDDESIMIETHLIFIILAQFFIFPDVDAPPRQGERARDELSCNSTEKTGKASSLHALILFSKV